MGILHELPQISRITIPRFISLRDAECIELIGFADASQCAYGACVYIRASSSSKVLVNLLTAKSKVSPLKIISIPRLELCAALLLARLASNVSRNVNICTNNNHLFLTPRSFYHARSPSLAGGSHLWPTE